MKNYNNMISIGGSYYQVDFDALDKVISSEESLRPQAVEDIETKIITSSLDDTTTREETTRKYHKGKEIDGPKYDTIGLMFQVLFGNDETLDDTLGIDRGFASMSISYKIAFNTLVSYGILKITEEEE